MPGRGDGVPRRPQVVHKIPSLLEYKSPTTLEMCDVITYLVEDPDPNVHSEQRKSARDRCCVCRRW